MTVKGFPRHLVSAMSPRIIAVGVYPCLGYVFREQCFQPQNPIFGSPRRLTMAIQSMNRDYTVSGFYEYDYKASSMSGTYSTTE